MIVEYTGDVSATLNIPMPTADKDLNEWIKQHAPRHLREPKVLHPEAVIGASGSFIADALVTQTPEQPKIIGSWSEEYIRALIYTVLEEIRESTV